jgi:hypothetical protein
MNKNRGLFINCTFFYMKRFTLFGFLIGLTVAALAHGKVDDYNRAFTLSQKYRDKVYFSNVTPKWIANSTSFWYVQNTAQGKVYLLVNAD